MPAGLRFCFQRPTSSRGKLAVLFPPSLEFWGEYEVKNTLCGISPCCVIREWCRDGRECVFLLTFGGELDFKVEVQGGFRAEGCAVLPVLSELCSLCASILLLSLSVWRWENPALL